MKFIKNNFPFFEDRLYIGTLANRDIYLSIGEDRKNFSVTFSPIKEINVNSLNKITISQLQKIYSNSLLVNVISDLQNMKKNEFIIKFALGDSILDIDKHQLLTLSREKAISSEITHDSEPNEYWDKSEKLYIDFYKKLKTKLSSQELEAENEIFATQFEEEKKAFEFRKRTFGQKNFYTAEDEQA